MTDKPLPPTGDDQERVRAEQVSAVFQTLPVSFFTILVNSTIAAWVLRLEVAPAPLAAWYAATWLMVALRAWSLWRFRRAAPGPREVPRWERVAVAGAWLSGTVWGAAAVLVWPAGSLVHQTFLVVLLAGMTAGAVSSLGSLIPAALGFFALALLPFCWRLVDAWGALGGFMSLMIGLYLLMLVVTALRINRVILDGLTTRFQRERAEATVKRQAYYDELTGLPNRRLLSERLQQELPRARRHGCLGAVLFLDLDHFKRINDSLGHQTGDELLRAVARRLQRRLRVEDTASRLGGDEFVVLLPDLGTQGPLVLREVEQVRPRCARSWGSPTRSAGTSYTSLPALGWRCSRRTRSRPRTS